MQNSWLWVMSGGFPARWYDRTDAEMPTYNPTNIIHTPKYSYDSMNHPGMTLPYTIRWDTKSHNMPNTIFNGSYRFDLDIDHQIIDDIIMEVSMYVTAAGLDISNFTPKAGMRIFDYIEFHGGGSHPVVERLEGDQMSLFEEIKHLNHQRSDTELHDHNKDVATLAEITAASAVATPVTYKFRLPFHFLKDKQYSLRTCKYKQTKPYIVCKLVQLDDYILEHGNAVSVDHATLGEAWSAATDTVTISTMQLRVKYVDYAPEAKTNLMMDYTMPMKVWGRVEQFDNWPATQVNSGNISIVTKGLVYGYLLCVRHSVNFPESHDTTDFGGANQERHSPYILQRLSTIDLRYDTQRIFDNEPAEHFIGHIMMNQLGDDDSFPVHYGGIGDNASYGGRDTSDSHATEQNTLNQTSGTKYLYWIPIFSEEPFGHDKFYGGLDTNRVDAKFILTVPDAWLAGTFRVSIWPLLYQDVEVKQDEMIVKEHYP